MMKVVGEEGTSDLDFVTYLKGEFLDAVYLQQNAFIDVDAATPVERQRTMFDVVENVLLSKYSFDDKVSARKFFQGLTQAFIDWNNTPQETPDFDQRKDALIKLIEEASSHV